MRGPSTYYFSNETHLPLSGTFLAPDLDTG
jgi:hypothetical protein